MATQEKARLFSPLRFSPFRWLLGGQLVSIAGSQLVPLVIVAITIPGSSRPGVTMGVVMAARFAALAMFIIAGGVLSDRGNRFKLLAISDLISIAALLPLIVFGAHTPIGLLALCSFFLGACEALYYPTYDSAVTKVVAKDDLLQANALTKMIRGVAKVLGPPMAGLVIVASGVKAALIIDAASFAISFITLLRLLPFGNSAATNSHGQGMLKEALGGVKAVVRLPWLSSLELMAVVHVVLAVAPWMVLLPIVSERLLGGMGSYGMLLGAFAAGAIPGAYLGSKQRFRLSGLVFLGGLLPFGIACVALGTTTNIWSLMAVFFIAGAGTEMADIVKMTAIQKQVPGEFLGRVFALDFFASFVMMPLGQVLTGLIVAPGNERFALICAGAIILITTPFVSLIPGIPRLSNISESASMEPLNSEY